MELKDCEIGTLVQVNKTGIVKDGVVSAIIPAKKVRPRDYFKCSPEEQKDFEEYLTVKFDSGEEQTFNKWEVDPRDSDLEREFRNAAAPVIELIDAKLDVAHKALREAVALSEEHGIPFYAHVSPLSQGYTPTSFEKKYDGVDSDIVDEVTGTTNNEYGGWTHSAVCY